MVARKKNSKTLLYIVLIFVALVLALVIFGQKGKNTNVSDKSTPSPIATTIKPVAATTPTQTVVSSGPVGSNFLTAKAGPKSGQVTLSWVKATTDTDKYSIVYRVNPGKYAYGAVNAVTVRSGVSNYSYVVGSLIPGTKYYFAIVPQKSGRSVAISPEVSVVAR